MFQKNIGEANTIETVLMLFPDGGSRVRVCGGVSNGHRAATVDALGKPYTQAEHGAMVC